jgi:nicotinate-nucleotide adenylyltransferase
MADEASRTVIIFGGSFDPPHVAHVRLPMLVREKIGADEVIYVPAGRAPHKRDRQQSDAADRLAMLRLALKDVAGARIITDEIDRAADGRPSYTVDTLERLAVELGPAVRMRLLIGTDQMRGFDRWKAPRRIEQLAEPVVMLRPPDTRESVLAAVKDERSRQAWASRLVEVPAIDVSATEIRARAARGEAIEVMVGVEVARYIREHRLYR